MSIKINELMNEFRTLIVDEPPKHWKDHHLRNHLNQGLRFAWGWLSRATETIFLEKQTITITQANVDAKDTIYPLEANSIFVSNYCNKDYEQSSKGFDFRPKLITSSDESVLIYKMDYLVPLPNIMLSQAPTETGSIELWAKKFPTRITKDTQILAYPEVMFDPILELAIFYAKRRDENPEDDNFIVQQLDQTLDLMRTTGGYPSGFEPDWYNVYDSGDL